MEAVFAALSVRVATVMCAQSVPISVGISDHFARAYFVYTDAFQHRVGAC